MQSDTTLYQEYMVPLDAQASEAAEASAMVAAEASASTIAKASASAAAIASASAMVDAINAAGLMTSTASAVFISDTTSLVDHVINSGLALVDPDAATGGTAAADPVIDIGDCIFYSMHGGTTNTCAGAPSCNIIGGELGISPGTAITGNFVETLTVANTATDAQCAADNLSAFAAGNAMAGAVNMVAEMGGLTFGPGVYTHGSALNIALTGPTVTLDAQGDANAFFVFIAGTTLTTCANSNIALINGARADNVFWILGSALTMGADSTLVGSVLTGTAITIGTNGKICGHALAQSAVTCETACTVSTLASCWGGTELTAGTGGGTTDSVAVYASGAASATARSVAVGSASWSGQVTFTISSTASASARETSTGTATAMVDALQDYDDAVIPDDGTTGSGASKDSVLLTSTAIATATGVASATATAILTFNVAASASATATAIAVATAAATATSDTTGAGTGGSTGTDSGIALGNCEVYAAHAGTTATCAGAPACDVTGSLDVSPGTSITGNWVATITSTGALNTGCATDGLAAWTAGRAMTGTAIVPEMGGLTFGPGVYTQAAALNIALTGPIVTLDAGGDPNAVFIFNAGTTLTTCANSQINLINGAVSGNVYWVLGSALTMGADSLLAGTVLTGTAVTVGTNGKICGRAIAQSAITCETNGDFDLSC